MEIEENNVIWINLSIQYCIYNLLFFGAFPQSYFLSELKGTHVIAWQWLLSCGEWMWRTSPNRIIKKLLVAADAMTMVGVGTIENQYGHFKQTFSQDYYLMKCI